MFYDGSLWNCGSRAQAHLWHIGGKMWRIFPPCIPALRESLSALQLVSARQAQAHKTRRLQCPSARCLKKGGLERT